MNTRVFWSFAEQTHCFSPNRKQSAPDSSSLRTLVDQPSPESCSQPAYGVTRPVGMAPTGHCGNAQMPLALSIATLMLDIGTEWTPSRLLPKSNAWSASSRCRTFDRWARAILRLRSEGHDEMLAQSPWPQLSPEFFVWQMNCLVRRPYFSPGISRLETLRSIVRNLTLRSSTIRTRQRAPPGRQTRKHHTTIYPMNGKKKRWLLLIKPNSTNILRLSMHDVHVRERKSGGRGQAQGRTGKTEAAKTHCSQLTSPADGVEVLLFRTLSCFLPLKSSLGFCG